MKNLHKTSLFAKALNVGLKITEKKPEPRQGEEGFSDQNNVST